MWADTWNFTFCQLGPRPCANGLGLELSDYKCAENRSVIGAHSGWGGKSLTWLNNNRRGFPLETQFSVWASWSLLSGMNEKWELVINVLQARPSFTNYNKIERLFRMYSFFFCLWQIIVYSYAKKYRFLLYYDTSVSCCYRPVSLWSGLRYGSNYQTWQMVIVG